MAAAASLLQDDSNSTGETVMPFTVLMQHMLARYAAASSGADLNYEQP